MKRLWYLLVACLLLISTTANAHPGGLDSAG